MPEHDPGSADKCQGSVARTLHAALVAFAAIAIACMPACAYSTTTTIELRDPSEVTATVDLRAGRVTVLPASPSPSLAAVPETEPPLLLQRVAGGPIVLRCDPCGPWKRTIVPMDGKIRFDDDLRLVDLDWTKKELDVGFYASDAPPSVNGPLRQSIVTPWSNVARVTKVRAPDRAMGARMLVGGAIATLLGVFAVTVPAESHHGVTTAFGVASFVIAAPLLGGSAWYLLAPPQRTELYGTK